MAQPALNREESRRVDRIAIDHLGFPGAVLMENAGRGCADVIEPIEPNSQVLIACGRGNNAGDGFVIARHLTLRGRLCRVVVASNPAQLTGDAASAYQMMQACGIEVLELYRMNPEEVASALDRSGGRIALLVDALLGTGATGDPRPPYAQLIRWMNKQAATRVAIDLPTGLDCDTGLPSEPTFRADHTCTLHAPKIGFTNPNAREYVGQLHLVGIGIPKVTV